MTSINHAPRQDDLAQDIWAEIYGRENDAKVSRKVQEIHLKDGRILRCTFRPVRKYGKEVKALVPQATFLWELYSPLLRERHDEFPHIPEAQRGWKVCSERGVFFVLGGETDADYHKRENAESVLAVALMGRNSGRAS